MLKKLDWYIIRKFIGTYLLSIVLIISIAVVIDITEKLDDFFESNAPLSEIVFDYYLNFIPYYANMFTPLFTFISVIFFTSKLASNSEIIAILASGIRFRRMMLPYFISAAVIALISFVLTGFVIPPANEIRLAFEDKYISKFTSSVARNIQLEVEKGVIVHIDRFEEKTNRGYRFSMERFDGKHLVSRMTATSVEWDSAYNWTVNEYLQRDFDGLYENITQGERVDTIIKMVPSDFFITAKQSPQMNNIELRNYIDKQTSRGAANLQAFKDEYYRRFSYPMAAFILTLIGVSLASKKVKGGMGLHLGIGIALSAFYILFSTISSSFGVSGQMNPILAVWLPNIVFTAVGVILYQTAPK